jgi:hypothetical protein
VKVKWLPLRLRPYVGAARNRRKRVSETRAVALIPYEAGPRTNLPNQNSRIAQGSKRAPRFFFRRSVKRVLGGQNTQRLSNSHLPVLNRATFVVGMLRTFPPFV